MLPLNTCNCVLEYVLVAIKILSWTRDLNFAANLKGNLLQVDLQSMEDALRKLDSHLNRIADVDYATRRCSLQGLVKILKEPAVIASKLAHNQTTVERLLIALLDRLADPMEKCRDLSLLLIEKIVYDCQSVHLAQNARNILLASCARFGDDPFPEPVEELRLRHPCRVMNAFVQVKDIAGRRLIEICNAVLLRLAQDQASRSSALIVDELLPALTHALTDSLSEAKRAAGTALRQVCKIAPWQVPPHILVVTKHLTSNLAHQHVSIAVPFFLIILLRHIDRPRLGLRCSRHLLMLSPETHLWFDLTSECRFCVLHRHQKPYRKLSLRWIACD